jgi:hypothetical protein
MKNFIRTATLTALVALGGASAFAQSDLKARIPFAFATPGGGMMTAGSYDVSKLNTGGIPAYRILNLDTKQSVIAVASESANRPAADKTGRAVLTFRCAGDNCAISGLYPVNSPTGSRFRAPLKNVDPATHIAEIMIPFGD